MKPTFRDTPNQSVNKMDQIIEALKAAQRGPEDVALQLVDRLNALDAENARLREMLRECAETMPSDYKTTLTLEVRNELIALRERIEQVLKGKS